MKQRWLVLSLLMIVPAMVQANEGSWNSSSFGGTMTLGQQRVLSHPVQPVSPPPTGAMAKTLAWQINIEGLIPDEFSIRVCDHNRCLPLPGLSGEKSLPHTFSVSGPLRFEYYSPVRGVLPAPVTILSNQITLGYQLK